jgi:hypothetical protein
MKFLTTAALTAAVAALSGCAVYPPGSVGVNGTVYSDEPVYYRGAPPAYYDPGPYGPYYGPPPVYYRPAPVIINRGNWDHDRRGDRDRWERDHGRDRDHDGRGPRPGPRPPAVQPAQPGPPQAGPGPGPRPDGGPVRNRPYANPDRPTVPFRE